MNKGLKKKILKVIKGSKLASLATIANGKPWVRYAVSHNQGANLNLYICTYRDSRKVKQIQENPDVHVIIGGGIDNLEAPYVQIAAKARVRSDRAIRKRYWQGFMKKYYTGPNDPQYVILELKPELIEYMSSEMPARPANGGAGRHLPQIYRIS